MAGNEAIEICFKLDFKAEDGFAKFVDGEPKQILE